MPMPTASRWTGPGPDRCSTAMVGDNYPAGGQDVGVRRICDTIRS